MELLNRFIDSPRRVSSSRWHQVEFQSGIRVFLLLLDANRYPGPLCGDDGVEGGRWDVDPEIRGGG